jgi:hypothetical protein
MGVETLVQALQRARNTDGNDLLHTQHLLPLRCVMTL